MIINLLFVLFGIVMLYFGGNWLVEGSSRLARSFGISALVVGLTVVAFGTSTPELVVSISAGLQGTNDIAVGNVVGSNIANIGLILGMAGLVYPIAVHASLVRREIPILIAVSLLGYAVLLDGTITRLEGVFLFLGIIVYTGTLLFQAQIDRKKTDLAVEEAQVEGESEPAIKASDRPREIVRVLLGLVVLIVGAQLTVSGATNLARALGVSELLIGITIVAVGTSLPELATSVIAAFNKQSDIAIGNVVGSNIFNILSILGLAAMLKPISLIRVLDPRSFNEILANPVVENIESFRQIALYDGPIMIAFAVLLLPLVLNKSINRREGIMLLILYTAFTIFAVVR